MSQRDRHRDKGQTQKIEEEEEGNNGEERKGVRGIFHMGTKDCLWIERRQM